MLRMHESCCIWIHHVANGSFTPLSVWFSAKWLLSCSLPCFLMHCNNWQHTATHCTTLQHVATHQRTLSFKFYNELFNETDSSSLFPLSFRALHHPAIAQQKNQKYNCATHLSWCIDELQYVAVCCSVVQCGAAYYSALQCVAVRCSALQCVVVRCSVLQCVAVCCSVL